MFSQLMHKGLIKDIRILKFVRATCESAARFEDIFPILAMSAKSDGFLAPTLDSLSQHSHFYAAFHRLLERGTKTQMREFLTIVAKEIFVEFLPAALISGFAQPFTPVRLVRKFALQLKAEILKYLDIIHSSNRPEQAPQAPQANDNRYPAPLFVPPAAAEFADLLSSLHINQLGPQQPQQNQELNPQQLLLMLNTMTPEQQQQFRNRMGQTDAQNPDQDTSSMRTPEYQAAPPTHPLLITQAVKKILTCQIMKTKLHLIIPMPFHMVVVHNN